MASFCLCPISEPSRSLYEFRTPTYCFEMAMEELMVNFKTWSIWTGTLCIHKSDLVQGQEEKNRDLHRSCHYTPGARQGTHVHSLVRGFYNAGLSSLAEAGSLNHQTKHLSFTVQLWYCCSDTCERGPSAVYAHQHVLCLVTWESQDLPFLLQIWHQLTASENWALLPASPEVNFPWRVGALKIAFLLYKLNSHATSGTRLYTVRYSGWKVVPLIKAGIQEEAQRRQWHPTPVLLPGKSHGWRSLGGCSPWGLEESNTTKRLHFHFSLSCIGEGNGHPLQCSCLENPRDRGAWWAAVYGVAQSRTGLEWLSSSSSTGRGYACVQVVKMNSVRQPEFQVTIGIKVEMPPGCPSLELRRRVGQRDLVWVQWEDHWGRLNWTVKHGKV